VTVLNTRICFLMLPSHCSVLVGWRNLPTQNCFTLELKERSINQCCHRSARPSIQTVTPELRGTFTTLYIWIVLECLVDHTYV